MTWFIFALLFGAWIVGELVDRGKLDWLVELFDAPLVARDEVDR